jgi:hypothetical protein
VGVDAKPFPFSYTGSPGGSPSNGGLPSDGGSPSADLRAFAVTILGQGFAFQISLAVGLGTLQEGSPSNPLNPTPISV